MEEVVEEKWATCEGQTTHRHTEARRGKKLKKKEGETRSTTSGPSCLNRASPEKTKKVETWSNDY